MRPFCFRTYRPKVSGYGYGTEAFIKCFRKHKLRFTFQNVLGRPKQCREGIVIHSGFPHFFQMETGKINIARVMLESDSLPKLWVDILNSMDEVWAASRFNARTFASAGVDRKKIFVIPDMVDAKFGRADHYGKQNNKIFRFLSVFLDLSLRKGWDIMLEEFLRSFGGSKNVEWVVQCSPDSAKKFRDILNKLSKVGLPVGNIKIIGKPPSIQSMAKLYKSADCYVLPSRGEGFGRPYMEALMAGLPVIATGFGGQRDFLNNKNSRLLKYRLVDVPAPFALDCYLMAGHRWAEPSRSDLNKALLEALKRPKRNPADLRNFSAENIMGQIKKRLEKVKKISGKIKKPNPEIVLYDDAWKITKPTPKAFAAKLIKLGKRFVVVGTGRNSKQLSGFLDENGHKIPFYIDRRSGNFNGKKTYSPTRLPKNQKVDAVLISCYPAAFAEWRKILKGKFKKTLTVIFYGN